MRISTAWAKQLSVNAMNTQQSKLAKLQMQLSTGLKISEPSEDPAASVRILDLDRTVAKTEQYQNNIASARDRLTLEDSALGTSGNILTRAKELALQAKNDTLNTSDRLSIKYEVDQLIEEMAGIANTQNANGEYIFSGDVSDAATFVKDSATDQYVYKGGQQQRTVQIAPARLVADGDLGYNVFENIDSVSVDKDENGKRSIFNTLKALSDSLAGNFSDSPAKITGDRFLKFGLDYSDPTLPSTTFDLTATLAPAIPTDVTIDLSGKKFSSVDELAAEINKQLAAAAVPAPGTGVFSDQMQARSNGNKIEFVSVDTGSSASITIKESTPPSGTFLADAGFTSGQSHVGSDLPTDQVFQTQMDDILTDFNAAQDSFLQARTSVGVRLNALDDQQSQNDKFVLDTKTTLSEIQDLDYADAISKFQLQTTSLQAAQQAFAKVSGLSLFNYL